MTAPHEPNDPTAPELGSTAQFQAFVKHNDEPDEARERAAADPDGPRAAAGTAGPRIADDDREIQFSEPVRSGPPVQSLRPEADLPPAELGSTAQFRAFATGEGSESTESTATRADTQPPAPAQAPAARPVPPAPRDGLEPPALPPADPNSKRNLLIALAVLLLVVIAVVLLFVLA